MTSFIRLYGLLVVILTFVTIEANAQSPGVDN
jgi:hypothetical protein